MLNCIAYSLKVKETNCPVMSKMEESCIDACVVSRPPNQDAEGKNYSRPIHKLASLLQAHCNNVTVVCGNDTCRSGRDKISNYIPLNYSDKTGMRIINYILIQVNIIFLLCMNKDKIDIVYMHKGCMSLPVVSLVPRLFEIKVCCIKLTDHPIHKSEIHKNSIHTKLKSILSKLTMYSADGVIAFSKSEAKQVPNRNTYILFTNYIDFDHFDELNNVNERKYEVGFVGRFEEEKGAVEFAKAANILGAKYGFRSKLVGDGSLASTVEQESKGCEMIDSTGWVDYEEIPSHMNEIQLLVMPSKNEALPTVLIEAMGCGAIPLTTDVGSIDTVVEEGESGFYLDSTYPMEIANRCHEILKRRDLPAVSETARTRAKNSYSRVAVEDNLKRVSLDLVSN